MDIDNQVCHDDPQFVKILETCLKMEIAEEKEKFVTNVMKIKKMKALMRTELDNRKRLKEKMTRMERIKVILSDSLTRLYASINETLDSLEIVKANADDRYKLMQSTSQEYKNLAVEYKETCQAYYAAYEEFPMAKLFNAVKVKLTKLQIEHMVVNYKKKETMTIIQQKKRIDWIRTRCKIVEFANIMVERSELQEQLTNLKANEDCYLKQFQSIEMEMRALRKIKEDQRRLRKQQMLEMAPPKINIPFRQMYNRKQMHTKIYDQWKEVQEPCDDTISVNTVALEELCINENSTISPEEIDPRKSEQSDDFKRAEVSAENWNFPNSAVSEKVEAGVSRAATPVVEESAKEPELADNDVEMKEICQEGPQKSQDSVKTQASCGTKEHFLKHRNIENTQSEVEAKKICLQRENDQEDIGKVIVPQSSNVTCENVYENVKSPPSILKIRKIETVNYNVPSSVPKLPSRSPSVASRFSAAQYECCDSNMSLNDQNFMLKGPSSTSIYEGSLCNYKISPNSNMSFLCGDENAQTFSPQTRHSLQEDKNQSTPQSFKMADFIKKKERNFQIF